MNIVKCLYIGCREFLSGGPRPKPHSSASEREHYLGRGSLESFLIWL